MVVSGETIMTDCVFCEIVAGRSPAKFLRPKNWHAGVLAFEPLNPITPGHALIIPKIHVEDFAEMPVVSGAVATAAAIYAKEFGGPFNVITSKGKVATQSVFHLHLHLIPRRKDDGLALPWYSGKGHHE